MKPQQISVGEWNFTVTDSTSGYYGYSTTNIAYGGAEESAEWIEEDPLNGTSNTLFPFADFQSLAFSAISADLSAPMLTLDTNGIEIVQNSTVLAVPSAPSGGSFTVTYG